MKLLGNFFVLFCKDIKKDQQNQLRGSEFVFDIINLMCYKLYKISLNRGGSYTNSPKWLKNKKTTMDPKNNDNNNCCIKLSKH